MLFPSAKFSVIPITKTNCTKVILWYLLHNRILPGWYFLPFEARKLLRLGNGGGGKGYFTVQI